MKKYLIWWRQGVLLIVLGFAASAVAQAQVPGSTGPTPGAAAVPLDGGASLLLAAGVGFGLKKLRQQQQKKPW